jgi:predicted phosphoadenosine phosphosulfate sulfurtransferase
VLHLVKEVVEERGGGKVNVMFYDEELVPDRVINFVDHYRRQDWVEMLWLAVPLKSTKFILGRTFDYVQWDRNRPWVRERPAWAFTLPEGDDRVLDQYSLDELVCNALAVRGKVAFLNGMRASESPNRLRAALIKQHFTYINETSPRSAACKPIYDWEENDVFRYFYEREIKYCPIYDYQIMAGMKLRVSTPLHAEAAKHISRQREVDPDFYNRLLRVFPEMGVQDRYYWDMNTEGLIAKYGQTFAGIRTYIMEKYSGEGGQLALALQRLDSIEKSKGYFPTDYVLKYFIGGAIKRMLVPQAVLTRDCLAKSNSPV